MPGHWVFNGDLQMAFHVDGSTGEVDAQAGVPGDTGSQVYQGDTSGYVVGDERITEFGKSSLEVEGSSATETADELPIGIEAAGGPYLVYRDIGKIVRLGKDPLSIDIGGPVGTPVATRDGTVWLPRTSAGFLCELRPGASATSCPVLLPEGDQGAMTVVDDRPMFVDTTADLLHAVEPDRLGAGLELGIDAPDTARVASTDVDGRVVMLSGNTMHLVDSGVDPARAPVPPDTVDLPDGEVARVDASRHELTPGLQCLRLAAARHYHPRAPGGEARRHVDTERRRGRQRLAPLLDIERVDERPHQLQVAGCLLLLAHHQQSYLTGCITAYII